MLIFLVKEVSSSIKVCDDFVTYVVNRECEQFKLNELSADMRQFLIFAQCQRYEYTFSDIRKIRTGLNG